jgi:hypothetical protein
MVVHEINAHVMLIMLVMIHSSSTYAITVTKIRTICNNNLTHAQTSAHNSMQVAIITYQSTQ